jgi:transglycosylase-like protein with SLT domain
MPGGEPHDTRRRYTIWILLGLVAGLALWRRASASAPMGLTAPSPPATTEQSDRMGIYNPSILTQEQRIAADLIVSKATAAKLDPAFMLALAVTESSLSPAIVGDDGISVGLFQINIRFNTQYTVADLADPNLNSDLAMTMMQGLIAQYPGHTFADYAEAWTLGGAGRFINGKRNPSKVTAMSRAISDLGLTLDLTGMP